MDHAVHGRLVLELDRKNFQPVNAPILGKESDSVFDKDQKTDHRV
jgi:hypothetical protein